MGILSCDIDTTYTRDTDVDENGNPSYPLRWIVQVDRDDYFGIQVLSLAQRFTGNGTPVPTEGTYFNYFGYVDPIAFPSRLTCKMIAADSPRTWVVEAQFTRGDSNNKEQREKRKQPDPLKWAPIYTIEWDEQQVPLEEARCMTALPTIKRGPGLEIHDGSTKPSDETLSYINVDGDRKYVTWPFKAALVNACGQQTIDPVMVVVRRPILVCKRNYPFTINSQVFNKLYTDTFNITKFLGCDPFTWKFLSCVANDPEEKEVEGYGTITYIPTITKLEYKHETWDIKLLNNGQSCFRYGYVTGKGMVLVKDPRSNTDEAKQTPLLFPTLQHVLKSTYKISTQASPQSAPTVNDFEEIESTEPMNLRPDGSQIGSQRKDNQPALPTMPDEKANHIIYRHLAPYDYNTMVPFLELVKEYKAYLRYYNLSE